ncbi:uncharacterized protein LOC117314599 [Pecten maximus]|uniref:uncharacterized protein LOC117314599 n=1 Tax=Pecten maximus TaxID=6579 RepID=UPI0014585656|nr:uncharacterized protein LOC117314599 [Pecten maximus]
MDRIYISLIITICLSVAPLSANTNNNEISRIPHGKSCGIQIGCYNASVTKPQCGNGNVTYSPDLNYTVEFKLTGCDGRRIEDTPVFWREINPPAADSEISSCRNQYQCLIPTGIIQKRIGNTLVMEIWTSIAPLHKLVGLGVSLSVRPPVGYVVSSIKSRNQSVKAADSGTKNIALSTKFRTTKKHLFRNPSHHPTYEDLLLEHLASRTLSLQKQDRHSYGRTSYRRIPSRTTGHGAHRVWRLAKIKHKTSGTSRNQNLDTRKNKLKKKKNSRKHFVGVGELSISGIVERVNAIDKPPDVTTRLVTGAGNKTRSNVGNNNKTAEIRNHSKQSIKTTLTTALPNTANNRLNVSHKFKPLSLNLTFTKNRTWTEGGKPKLNTHSKMEIKIKNNISDADAALDSILAVTSQNGRHGLVKKYHGYAHISSNNGIKSGKQNDTIDHLLYNCVKFLCGQQGRRWRCPKILVLQCLHLSSGEKRQLMLGEIRGEMQQLIDMFNVSKSDLKEIEKSAKATAHQLMKQPGNADILTKKIGIATAEILRKLYNASYLASREALTDRFGWSGRDAKTSLIRGFGEWSNWSRCSVSCGKGMTTRSRVCPSNTVYCKTKPSHQTRKCMESTCQNVKVRLPSPWSRWSSCSVTCGLGKETRSRGCDESNGQEAKQANSPYRGMCKGPMSMSRLCIMSSCSKDSNPWRKTVLLGYDTVLNCKSRHPWSSTDTYWITPGGKRVSQTAQLQRVYMVGDTLVIHGIQKTDEGLYHCVTNQLEPSRVATTDTRIEVLTCSSSPCENGGKCQEGTYSLNRQLRKVTCSCRSGFGGVRCQDHVSHSHFHMYLLISLLIGLLVSVVIGFIVYICAFRKVGKEKPKKAKGKTPDNELQKLETVVEEHDTSTNLDSSIIHSDDSWIEITEKDYKDFQTQKESNLKRKHRPVSRSLPALHAFSRQTSSMSPHPFAERTSRSSTETRSRHDYGDTELESRPQNFSKQERGYAYEVPTSPDIKTKIVLIGKDRKSKSTPNLKTKKTVSFQKIEANHKTRSSVDNVSFTHSTGSQLPPETSSPHQVPLTASHSAKMSTASALPQVPSTRPTIQMSTDSPSNKVSTPSSSHQSSSARPLNQMATSDHSHQESTTTYAKQKPTGGDDYLDMSGGRPTEKELVIVTSDSILGLQGDKTQDSLNEDVKFVHKRTSTRGQRTHSKLEESVKHLEHDMDYTPVYYTFQPSPLTKDDVYVDMCEFVHKKTFTPEQQDGQHADYEQLYINLTDKPAEYPDYETPDNAQTKNHSHLGTNMTYQMEEDSYPTTTNLKYDGKSPPPEDLSLNHETNSSNHSYTEDDSIYKQDQVVSDSQQFHQSTSLVVVRDVECLEMQASKTTTKSKESTSYESDEDFYESDQSSTLCPMPDLDESEFLDECSWDATLKGYSFDKVDDSADVVETLMRCFESEKNKPIDAVTKPDTALTLPSDIDKMTPTFELSLGDLGEIDNDQMFRYLSEKDENEQISSVSVDSCTGDRVTQINESSGNDISKKEIGQQTSNSCGINNSDSEENKTASRTSKSLSPSSPRARMCRGHYEMVYGPASYPSPICQLDAKSSSDDKEMTEGNTQIPQVYPIEHHYTSKSKSDFP